MLEVTQTEAASMLNVSTRTLAKRLKRCPEARLIRPGKRVNIDMDILCPGAEPIAEPSEPRAEPVAEPSEGDQHFMVLRSAYQNQTLRMRELEATCKQQQKSKFSWQMLTLAAGMTASILAGAICLGYGLYLGRGAQLAQTQETLTASQLVTDDVRARLDDEAVERQRLQKEKDELMREIVGILQDQTYSF